jgi:hypothetical protein
MLNKSISGSAFKALGDQTRDIEKLHAIRANVDFPAA